jgi:non-canonical (house-cleaning) NTP pyrophosphatase
MSAVPAWVVAVGGTNELKVNSTGTGLARLLAEDPRNASVTVKSDVIPDCDHVPPQPFGLKQGRAGALYRAQAILDKVTGSTFGVGIENCVILFDDADPAQGGLDTPIVCVVRRGAQVRKATFASGPGFPVEGRYVEASLAAGQKTTCGKLIAAETGFDHANWHFDYAGRATDRGETLAQAVFTAFAVYLAGH